MSNNLTIAILSQNDVRESPSIIIDDFKNRQPDIYAEFTQEDRRSPNDPSIIAADFLQNMQTPIISSLNANATKQNIITKLFVKNGLVIQKEEHGSIPVLAAQANYVTINGLSNTENDNKSPKSVFKGIKDTFKVTKAFTKNAIVSVAQTTNIASKSKGSAYIKIIINNLPFLFVNLHLPIDTSDKDTLGLKYRKDSMIKILSELKTKNLYDKNTIIIVGGDLNFRIFPNPANPELYEDQLTKILENSNELPIPLKEITSDLENSNEIFTCKFQKEADYRNNEKLEHCREQPIPDTMADIKTVQSNCGDKKRIPSRCDRFLLTKPDNIKINVLLNKSHYIKEIDSDHNAIYSILEILPEEQGFDIVEKTVNNCTDCKENVFSFPQTIKGGRKRKTTKKTRKNKRKTRKT